MMHWVNDYIGKPWEKGAAGPDAYDCGGLVRTVMRTHYGIELRDIGADCASLIRQVRAIDSDPAWSAFAQVGTPQDGDLVKLIRQTRPMHVGIWVALSTGGGILHAHQGGGVVFDEPWIVMAKGWGKLEYYRFKGALCRRC